MRKWQAAGTYLGQPFTLEWDSITGLLGLRDPAAVGMIRDHAGVYVLASPTGPEYLVDPADERSILALCLRLGAGVTGEIPVIVPPLPAGSVG